MSYPENETVAVALALAHVRQTIPGGPNDLAVAAFNKLADSGDRAALDQVEAWLARHPLSKSYGDRDDDPTGWDLDPAALVALARWWERLGLAAERGARLATSVLEEDRSFGPGSWTIFRATAPLLADQVAPRLLAALPGANTARRERIADGLGAAPTPAAIAALLTLLDDPDRMVRHRARFALQWVWQQRYASEEQKQTTVDALIGALDSPSSGIRLGAVQALPFLGGHQHRTSIRFPLAFERVLPAVARRLADPEAAVRQVAAERVNGAGYHLDQLRPSYARRWEALMRLPDDDALLPLLDEADEVVVRAGLYLAGRRAGAAETPSRTAMIGRIITRLAAPSGEWLTIKAAINATARLRAVAAIPVIVPFLTGQRAGHDYDAALVLGQLGYGPARPAVVRLLSHPLDYYLPAAREVLAMLDDDAGRTAASK